MKEKYEIVYQFQATPGKSWKVLEILNCNFYYSPVLKFKIYFVRQIYFKIYFVILLDARKGHLGTFKFENFPLRGSFLTATTIPDK